MLNIILENALCFTFRSFKRESFFFFSLKNKLFADGKEKGREVMENS